MGDFSQYGYQSKKECCEVCLQVIPAFLASELKLISNTFSPFITEALLVEISSVYG
jgi:hypothetical protein